MMGAYKPEAPEAAPQSPEQAPLSHVPAPDYIAEFEPIEDDLEEDPIDYPSNEEEEEEPSAPTDPASHVPDAVPSSKETEPLETDESAATPPSPHTVVPLSHTGLRRARKTVRPQLPLSPTIEAHIAEYGSAPTPPLPPPSLLSHLLSLLPIIPSPPLL
ncbi:hypothetical protein Tco_1217652 [Tanacetum coccineum]